MKVHGQQRRATLMLIGLGFVAVAALSTALHAGPTRGANIKVDARVESPKIIAVRVRHDMCPVCKQIDPKFPPMIRQASDDSVLFVTLDLTNETTQKQAALLVGALGLESAWTGDMSKMGSVSFLDGTTKRLISFVQTTDTKKAQTSLRRALSSLPR